MAMELTNVTVAATPERPAEGSPEDLEPSFVSSAASQGPSDLRCIGENFVDAEGRTVLLRGINLGGSSKLPTSPVAMATHLEGGSLPNGAKWSFYDGRAVSFVGRPFPLAEADEHLGRLRAWGFNLLRFVTTWEAVEHAGPGVYDTDYLAYVRALVERSATFGFWVYMDPHQDAWSRFTGGSGHPAWTLEEVGMDLRKLVPCAAATLHQARADPAAFPHMLWPTNVFKYAAATMFTLFWAGDAYAPSFMVCGEGVQGYLQRHYIGAMAALARALRGLPNVLGFGTMNEPMPGYLGVKRLDRIAGPLRNGHMPTALQGMGLASGVPTAVGYHSTGSLYCLITGRPQQREVLNAEGASVWVEGRGCPWRAEGVWSVEEGGKLRVAKPEYFAGADFGKEHYLPFARRYAAAIQEALGSADAPMCFVEMPPADLGLCSFPSIGKEELPNAINAAHWYDQITLFAKRYFGSLSWDVQTNTPAIGSAAVFRLKCRQLSELRELSSHKMGGVPTLIGECGIPYNLDASAAYVAGDWRPALRAMDATVSALEEANVHYALWCYTADHSPEWGDNWNREDLSIYSPSCATDASDPYSGGRALHAIARPFASRVQGTLLHSRFDMRSRRYGLSYESATSSSGASGERARGATEIFVPLLQYPSGMLVHTSGGTVQQLDVGAPRPPFTSHRFVVLAFTPAAGATRHVLVISPRKPAAGGGAGEKKEGGAAAALGPGEAVPDLDRTHKPRAPWDPHAHQPWGPT